MLASAVARGLELPVIDAPPEDEHLSQPAAGGAAADDDASMDSSVPPATEAPERSGSEPPERGHSGPSPTPSSAFTAGEEAVGRDVPAPPTAVLLDSGDLDDVADVLEGLGVSTTRVDAGAGDLEGWEAPGRLLVASARVALSLSISPLADDPTLVGIAVADSDSQTAAKRVRQLGFRYLVSRPVHPDALRILIQGCLYRGGEQRRAERLAHGSEVTWRAGLRRHRATLVEISSTGGRLHAREPLKVGSTIRLTIGPEMRLRERLVLRARVVRRERHSEGQHELPHAVALSWVQMEKRRQARLDALLAARSVGPARLHAPVMRAADAPAAAQPERDAAPPQTKNRRRHPRAVLDQQIVALDAADRAQHALVGRDVSRSGMRIDPHADLDVGDALTIALIDASDPAPLVVAAKVLRDDGRRGLGLEFIEMTEETARKIEGLVRGLPSVQALQPTPRPVVMGRVIR